MINNNEMGINLQMNEEQLENVKGGLIVELGLATTMLMNPGTSTEQTANKQPVVILETTNYEQIIGNLTMITNPVAVAMNPVENNNPQPVENNNPENPQPAENNNPQPAENNILENPQPVENNNPQPAENNNPENPQPAENNNPQPAENNNPVNPLPVAKTEEEKRLEREAEAQKRMILFDEQYKKQFGKNVSDASGILYKGVKNMLNKDYEDAAEVEMDVVKLVLSLANEAFYKHLPYFGGFIDAFVKDVNGIKSDTAQILSKMDELKDAIEEVRDAVNKNGKEIREAIVEVDEKKVMDDFNNKAEALMDLYTSQNPYFNGACKYVNDEKNEYNPEVIKKFERIYTTLDPEGIVTRKGATYYLTYKNFLSGLLQNGLTNTRLDIFTLTDKHYLGNGVDRAKNDAQRRYFLNEVYALTEMGNSVLGTSMEMELQQLAILKAMTNVQIQELEEKLLTCTASEKDAIKTKLVTLNSNVLDIDARFDVAKEEKRKIEELVRTVREKITGQKEDIEQALADFNERIAKNPVNETVKISGKVYGVIAVGNDVCYPTLNAKGNIEYRDIYGNLIATRNVSVRQDDKKYVDKYDIKKGHVYYIREIQDSVSERFFTQGEYRCLVLDVWESTKDCFWGTTRRIRIQYLEGPRKGQIWEQRVRSEDDKWLATNACVVTNLKVSDTINLEKANYIKINT